MSRRKLVVGSPTADYGPAIVLQRGERRVAEIPDIDRPDVRDRSVKAARVRCIYADLWSEGRLTHGQREAADRLAIMWEAVHGSRTDVGGSVGWRASTVPERCLQAAGDLRMAAQRLGAMSFAWLAIVAVFNRWPWGKEDVSRLAGHLQTLAEMWGMD